MILFLLWLGAHLPKAGRRAAAVSAQQTGNSGWPGCRSWSSLRARNYRRHNTDFAAGAAW